MADARSTADSDAPRAAARPEGVHARRTRIRRGEILDAASRTFATKGFHKASLQEIAAAAGITTAGLLHHFGSKDQLLTALLDHRDASEVAEGGDSDRPHGKAFLDHLVATADRNAGRPGITQLYAVLSAEGVTDEHPAQSYFRSRYAGLREIIITELRAAQQAGDAADDLDPAEVATVIIAVMDGLQIQWLYEPESVDMPRLLAKLITAITRDGAWTA